MTPQLGLILFGFFMFGFSAGWCLHGCLRDSLETRRQHIWIDILDRRIDRLIARLDDAPP